MTPMHNFVLGIPVARKTCLACMHVEDLGDMLSSDNSYLGPCYHDEEVAEHMNMKRVYELNTCMKADTDVYILIYIYVYTYMYIHGEILTGT